MRQAPRGFSLPQEGLIAFALLSIMSSARAEQLPIRTYSTADGLPHNVINRIVRDSRGFLWFCTAGGLSRFDGYTFTNYGTEQGLPHASVNDILETCEGEYWVATGGGLAKFNPNGTPSSRTVNANESSLTRRHDLAVGGPGVKTPGYSHADATRRNPLKLSKLTTNFRALPL